MELQQLIEQYGYWAILIGTFLKGETILVIGGYLCHRGYLDLPGVIIAAFIGTYISDQLFIHLGRVKGTTMLERRPNWQKKSARVLAMVRRNQNLAILGFRFLYGVRSISPFAIGISGVSPLRFLVLNGLGAFLWACVISSLGFMLGKAAELFINSNYSPLSHQFSPLMPSV